MLRNGIQDMVVVVNNRRCLKGVDSRSKRSPEFVSIDEESQHEIIHVFCLGKHPLEGFCQEAILLPDATFDNFFPWLLVDSRVMDVPMAYNPTFVMLSSLKPLLFKSLKNELPFSDNAGT